MKDISYHILDIVQNSLNAGATCVWIELSENTEEGTLRLSIGDNGKGMTVDQLNQATDPFYTSSVNKKVGLGLPLLKQNAELSGGKFSLSSEPEKGTCISAIFNTGNIDMLPLGNLGMTIRLLVASNPETDFEYRHSKNDSGFELSTAKLRNELDDVKLNQKEVLDYISDYVDNGLKAIFVDIN